MNIKKVCPRCKEKLNSECTVCTNCNLSFTKLKNATNSYAKKMIKQKTTNYVIYTSTLPYDISKIKLLLISLFTGFVGGHLYYVGRYLKGIIYSCFFAVLVGCTVATYYFNMSVSTLLSYPIAVYVLMYLFDIFNIVFGKFKVPVAIKPNILKSNLKGED